MPKQSMFPAMHLLRYGRQHRPWPSPHTPSTEAVGAAAEPKSRRRSRAGKECISARTPAWAPSRAALPRQCCRPPPSRGTRATVLRRALRWERLDKRGGRERRSRDCAAGLHSRIDLQQVGPSVALRPHGRVRGAASVRHGSEADGPASAGAGAAIAPRRRPAAAPRAAADPPSGFPLTGTPIPI
jgi:hypothetical protein